MATVFVGIGSNRDRESALRATLGTLRERYLQVTCSSVYECPAVGLDGPAFYNLVVFFDTLETLEEVRTSLRDTEQLHGRNRIEDQSSRTIDLDLLLFGDLVDDSLRLPRDDIERYAFVLKPMAELVPHEKHPMLGLTYDQMWRRFDASAQPLKRVDLSL